MRVNSNVSSSFLFALFLSVKHAKERRSREKSDAFFVFDFFPFERMQRRRKLYAQAEEYDTRVKIRAKMSIAFYIELSTLSLSLSPPLSPFLSLSPPLSFSNFRPRSLPLLSDFAINIQNILFFSLNPCLRRWIQLSITRNRAPNR